MTNVKPPELRTGPKQLNLDSIVWLVVVDEPTQRYVMRRGKLRARYVETPADPLFEVWMDGSVQDISPSRVFAERCAAVEACRKWNEWIAGRPAKSTGGTPYRATRLEGLSSFR